MGQALQGEAQRPIVKEAILAGSGIRATVPVASSCVPSGPFDQVFMRVEGGLQGRLFMAYQPINERLIIVTFTLANVLTYNIIRQVLAFLLA